MDVQLNSLHRNTGISNSIEKKAFPCGTLRSGGGLLEYMGLAHYICIIPNKSQRPNHEREVCIFSPTLLVDVEVDQLKRVSPLHSLSKCG